MSKWAPDSFTEETKVLKRLLFIFFPNHKRHPIHRTSPHFLLFTYFKTICHYLGPMIMTANIDELGQTSSKRSMWLFLSFDFPDIETESVKAQGSHSWVAQHCHTWLPVPSWFFILSTPPNTISLRPSSLKDLIVSIKLQSPPFGEYLHNLTLTLLHQPRPLSLLVLPHTSVCSELPLHCACPDHLSSGTGHIFSSAMKPWSLHFCLILNFLSLDSVQSLTYLGLVSHDFMAMSLCPK